MQGILNKGKEGHVTLKKCIYGHAQAAWQYSKKADEILKKLRFIRGNIDPCLYVKRSEKGKACVAFYVIDNLMIGDIKAIHEAITTLKKMGW